jgi:hypothetical protein
VEIENHLFCYVVSFVREEKDGKKAESEEKDGKKPFLPI